MMKCYECSKPIRNESQKAMEEVRMFIWSDTPGPFHKEFWEKTHVSKAKKYYAKTFIESLIVLAAALIAT